ncbi:MAG: glycosyltransferase [Flavobacteriales bacterium]|nr:glycosyltransferase [Flavobacteriales bacterium]NNK81136.1 glycosyltransferase [Flavobacteriales bacterium]
MSIVLLVIYGACLLFIFCYSLVQLSLVLNYKKNLGEEASEQTMYDAYGDTDDWPKVTIQLPVYNELYVVERLIDSVASLEYPESKLEVQVLDDSTDESYEIAAKRIEFWKARGLNIKHVNRPDRKGYKAGALAYGLDKAQGDFTAIFDADFVPEPDFLLRTLPHFTDEKVGVVQTRWEHLNEDYSLLTRLQAFGLNAHFSIEQKGRNASKHFINFNGTAGIWRNACIEDAGGWESDTLTEDLDLSYRAQLKGWQFIYKEKIGSPAELPAAMMALKNQQYRWTKGAAECAVKNLPKVLRSRGIGISTKVHALFHLMSSFIFVCVIATALLSVPMLFIKFQSPDLDIVFKVASLFLLSFFILAYFYWTSMKHGQGEGLRSFGHFLMLFPLFLSVSMGLSLHNAIAVIEGYLGRKTPFIRTPKFSIQTADDTFKGNRYLAHRINPLTFVEIFLTLYFLGGIGLAFYLKDFGLIPFHLMLCLGFGLVSFYSVRHARS